MDTPEVKVALTKPITLASGEQLTELVLREPTALDMRSMPLKDEIQLGDLLDIAAAVAGLPLSVINGVSPPDTMAVVRAMGKFMVGGTGGRPQ